MGLEKEVRTATERPESPDIYKAKQSSQQNDLGSTRQKHSAQTPPHVLLDSSPAQSPSCTSPTLAIVVILNSHCSSLQALRGVRTIQTSADTTQLHSSAPSDPAQPFTVKLHEESFRSYLCDTPELEVEVTKDKLLTMYKQMQLARRMEMAADALYKAKLIRGFCHLATGQVRSSCFVVFFY